MPFPWQYLTVQGTSLGYVSLGTRNLYIKITPPGPEAAAGRAPTLRICCSQLISRDLLSESAPWSFCPGSEFGSSLQNYGCSFEALLPSRTLGDKPLP